MEQPCVVIKKYIDLQPAANTLSLSFPTKTVCFVGPAMCLEGNKNKAVVRCSQKAGKKTWL